MSAPPGYQTAVRRALETGFNANRLADNDIRASS